MYKLWHTKFTHATTQWCNKLLYCYQLSQEKNYRHILRVFACINHHLKILDLLSLRPCREDYNHIQIKLK